MHHEEIEDGNEDSSSACRREKNSIGTDDTMEPRWSLRSRTQTHVSISSPSTAFRVLDSPGQPPTIDQVPPLSLHVSSSSSSSPLAPPSASMSVSPSLRKENLSLGLESMNHGSKGGELMSSLRDPLTKREDYQSSSSRDILSRIISSRSRRNKARPDLEPFLRDDPPLQSPAVESTDALDGSVFGEEDAMSTAAVAGSARLYARRYGENISMVPECKLPSSLLVDESHPSESPSGMVPESSSTSSPVVDSSSRDDLMSSSVRAPINATFFLSPESQKTGRPFFLSPSGSSEILALDRSDLVGEVDAGQDRFSDTSSNTGVSMPDLFVTGTALQSNSILLQEWIVEDSPEALQMSLSRPTTPSRLFSPGRGNDAERSVIGNLENLTSPSDLAEANSHTRREFNMSPLDALTTASVLEFRQHTPSPGIQKSRAKSENSRGRLRITDISLDHDEANRELDRMSSHYRSPISSRPSSRNGISDENSSARGSEALLNAAQGLDYFSPRQGNDIEFRPYYVSVSASPHSSSTGQYTHDGSRSNFSSRGRASDAFQMLNPITPIRSPSARYVMEIAAKSLSPTHERIAALEELRKKTSNVESSLLSSDNSSWLRSDISLPSNDRDSRTQESKKATRKKRSSFLFEDEKDNLNPYSDLQSMEMNVTEDLNPADDQWVVLKLPWNVFKYLVEPMLLKNDLPHDVEIVHPMSVDMMDPSSVGPYDFHSVPAPVMEMARVSRFPALSPVHNMIALEDDSPSANRLSGQNSLINSRNNSLLDASSPKHGISPSSVLEFNDIELEQLSARVNSSRPISGNSTPRRSSSGNSSAARRGRGRGRRKSGMNFSQESFREEKSFDQTPSAPNSGARTLASASSGNLVLGSSLEFASTHSSSTADVVAAAVASAVVSPLSKALRTSTEHRKSDSIDILSSSENEEEGDDDEDEEEESDDEVEEDEEDEDAMDMGYGSPSQRKKNSKSKTKKRDSSTPHSSSRRTSAASELSRFSRAALIWTEEEDILLRQLVDLHGPRQWSRIAASMPGRRGKQCRERWFNHLDPSVKKESWTGDEDQLIVCLHGMHKNQWSLFSRIMPGRTANAIKNHWNSTLRRLVSRHPSFGSVYSAMEKLSVELGSLICSDDHGKKKKWTDEEVAEETARMKQLTVESFSMLPVDGDSLLSQELKKHGTSSSSKGSARARDKNSIVGESSPSSLVCTSSDHNITHPGSRRTFLEHADAQMGTFFSEEEYRSKDMFDSSLLLGVSSGEPPSKRRKSR